MKRFISTTPTCFGFHVLKSTTAPRNGLGSSLMKDAKDHSFSTQIGHHSNRMTMVACSLQTPPPSSTHYYSSLANFTNSLESLYPSEWLESFHTYNKLNAKFRVAITNTCNMNCFFCHNEGMKNPRSPGDPIPLKKQGPEPFPIQEIIRLCNDFCDLGGTQLNITGGEPLARKDIVSVLKSINKQNTRVVLNSNVLLADRLLKESEKIEQVDAIYASLHTTRETDFKKYLGIGGGASQVMRNMIRLKDHGYRVQINYSLGEYNRNEFENVLKFALPNKIDLKVISLIRSNLNKNQYGEMEEIHHVTSGKEEDRGENVSSVVSAGWSNPKWLEDLLESNGVEICGTREGFGGRVKIYKTSSDSDHRVEIKNIGRGRLRTDYCNGCRFSSQCGEGIYAMRSGVDGLFKPCVLNSDKFIPIQIESASSDYKHQILSVIHTMVGNWKNHKFVEGPPQ
ncbi:hypothetical protein C9374_003752 [Naegleria lovaniensis]|uniref:Radical SAM core domain-containing protein n=1 Tax=Naegleria lovaniensis TaxID=51637 RepID=A0AA88H3R6_NAELO|nr:uncharacterized protein C9374_003752 [Naegleria lovaniensis]KAG2393988.1 hypothetical protein C9374_003752 [Naegleria lovaniensis]